MFDTLASDRLPRAPRRQLSATALRKIDEFVTTLDRMGANDRAFLGRADNDDITPTTKRRLLAA